MTIAVTKELHFFMFVHVQGALLLHFANPLSQDSMATPTLLRIVPAHNEPVGGLLTQRAFPPLPCPT